MTDRPELRVIQPLRVALGSNAEPFQCLCSDNRLWWVKQECGAKGYEFDQYEGRRRHLLNELVVTLAAQVIGAPILESSLVAIDQDHQLDTSDGPRTLRTGIGHATLHHNAVFMRRTLEHRKVGHNAKGHAALIALYLWTLGQDAQWLCTDGNSQTLGFDFGVYLTGQRAGWEPSGEAYLRRPHSLPDEVSYEDLDKVEVRRLIGVLRSVDWEQAQQILSEVPTAWTSMTPEMKEWIERLLVIRAAVVAEQLEGLQ